MGKNVENEYIPGLAKGVVVAIIGQLVEKGVGFLYNLLLPILIGISNFGIYTIAISLTHIATIISFGGLTKGIVKKGSDFHNEGNLGKLYSLIKFSIIFSVTIASIFILFSFSFPAEISKTFFKSSHYGWIIKLLFLSIPFTLTTGILLSFTVSLKIIRYSILVKNILEPLLKLSLFILFFALGFRLTGAVISFSSTMVICSIIALFIYLKTKNKLPKVGYEKINIKKILSFSLPLILIPSLFYNILMWINTLIIGIFDTNYKVGLFALGYKISLIFLIFINGFIVPFEPRISDFIHNNEFEELKKFHHLIVRWIFLLGSPAMFFLTFFSKETLLCINIKFLPAWIFLSILSSGAIFTFIGSPALSIVIMSGKSTWQLLNTIFLVISNMLISIALIYYFKAIGIAISILITYILFAIITTLEVKKLYKYIPIPASILKILIFNTIPILVIYILNNLSTIHSITKITFIKDFFIFFTLYIMSYFLFEKRDKISEDATIIKNTYYRIKDHMKNPEKYL